MKNITKILLCLMLVLCMALSMVACAGGEEEKKDETASKSEVITDGNTEGNTEGAEDEGTADATQATTQAAATKSAESVALQFVEGAFSGNYDLTASTVYPAILEATMEGFEESAQQMSEMGISYKGCTVDSVEDASAEIADYEELLRTEYNFEGSIEELRKFSISVEISYGGETSETEAMVYAAMIDGAWYAIPA